MLRNIHGFFGEYQLELNVIFSIKPILRIEFVDKKDETVKTSRKYYKRGKKRGLIPYKREKTHSKALSVVIINLLGVLPRTLYNLGKVI